MYLYILSFLPCAVKFNGEYIGKASENYAIKKAEKGFFEFGGSTVILAFQKDAVVIDNDIIQNTQDGYETIVKMGETIGRKGLDVK